MATFIMGLDFSYLIVYFITLSLACVGAIQVFQTLQSLWRYMGVYYIALSQHLAGLFDTLENFALANILFEKINSLLSVIAK